MMSTPVRDEMAPAAHLRLASLSVGLDGEECWPVVDFGKGESGGCRCSYACRSGVRFIVVGALRCGSDGVIV